MFYSLSGSWIVILNCCESVFFSSTFVVCGSLLFDFWCHADVFFANRDFAVEECGAIHGAFCTFISCFFWSTNVMVSPTIYHFFMLIWYQRRYHASCATVSLQISPLWWPFRHSPCLPVAWIFSPRGWAYSLCWLQISSPPKGCLWVASSSWPRRNYHN